MSTSCKNADPPPSGNAEHRFNRSDGTRAVNRNSATASLAGSPPRPHAPRWLHWLLPLALLSGCEMRHTPLTLEEASRLTLNASVDGVPFNVPITYTFSDFKQGGEWPHPTKERLQGYRPAVDVIKVTALLPDFAPYTAHNAKDYEELGWGKKAKVYMTRRKNLEIRTLDVIMPRLKKLPEDPRVQGFLRFEDPISKTDEYFNQLQVGYDMVNIRCDKPEIDPKPPASPYCEIRAGYRQQFTMKVTFHRQYLPQWSAILEGSRHLLDGFVAAAQADTRSAP